MSLFNYEVDFDSPWYLLLLLLAPPLWWFSFRSLAGLGGVRRMVVLALRTAVLVLFVLGLAGVQWVRSSDNLTVIYLLDQSRSIPAEQRQELTRYVNAAILKHREDDDQASVIRFAREAAIEMPPFDDDIHVPEQSEVIVDPDYTNLAAALKLAQATFPENSAKRIVVVSDGNENLGDAVEQARSAVDAGIGIDVVPIRYAARAEVVMEKVALPNDVHKGQPFDVRVVVNNTTQPTAEETGEVNGRLVISRTSDDEPVVISDEPIALPPGKHVFTVRQEIDESQFYTYEAKFVPDNPDDDAMLQNNRSTAYTHIRGSGQVLLIEDFEHPGEHDILVSRLRANNIEVTVRQSNQLFTSLGELQPYDTVILANVPKSSGDEGDETGAGFSDEQIKILVRNTEVMGCGLVMLGGPSSFGAGGWANTELEKAMPLDFTIKSAKVVPKGALAMLMHASELAQGNYWQKVIAQEALKSLGPHDYCGVLHWDGAEKWLWNHPNGLVRVGDKRDLMIARLGQMTPGDMPDFDPTMIMAAKSFARLNNEVAVKHMIIISDGDPSPASAAVIRRLIADKVTVSTVAVGTHGAANSAELKRIANATGGKYYQVNNNKALPRIFQIEARRVARPLVYENEGGMTPYAFSVHEMLNGIEGDIPPITGYVMTTKKVNPLVEVSLLSPLPTTAPDNNTILASWNYGVGKAVCFTSDAGMRWSSQWTNWQNYDKFFTQLVRWSMRPVGDTGKFTVATEVEDGQVRVVVTALDKEDQFLNFLPLQGAVIGPNGEPLDVRMRQTAPGRYVGTFDGTDAGSYFVALSAGADQAPIRTGVNVPYSAEFRDRVTDETLLANLAEMPPRDGRPGKVVESPDGSIDAMLAINPFRRGELAKATSSRDAWYYALLLASGLFFADVFFRRVTVRFDWAPPLARRAWAKLLRREPAPAPVEYMQRLRSRKAEVTETIEQRRAAARFEPAPDAAVDAQVLDRAIDRPADQPPPTPKAAGATGLAPEKEQDSYTSRLLKAKKQVWEERDGK